MYKRFVKRIIDIVFSVLGIAVLFPVWLVIALAIVLDDPGPVLFKQKRIGKKKNGEPTFFLLYKFRSMKMSTPHDMPTHMLDHPEQYITRVGGFLRKSSLDELPQLLNILKSEMSIIGPRPALWNQTDLIEKREQYGANDSKPGLSGLAQIRGRDELPLDAKAKLDGEYTQKLNSGKFEGFAMDCRCFFGTIRSVLKHEGVIEGGTGKREQEKCETVAACGDETKTALKK